MENLTPEQKELSVVISTQSEETKNLILQTYTIAFEYVLQKVSSGESLRTILANYHLPIDASLFRTWIYKDEGRKRAWLVAKALSAEVMEEDILRIADDVDNDINRAQMQITTRKWLMQVNNKRRYGDTKFIESTHTTETVLTTEQLEQSILERLGIINNA